MIFSIVSLGNIETPGIRNFSARCVMLETTTILNKRGDRSTMSFKKRLLSRIKNKVSQGLGRFSGEYSTAAPEEMTPYETGVDNSDQEVGMARLNRPSAAKSSTTPEEK